MHDSGQLPVTVLLGDPSLDDPSKPGGRFTEDDFDQVVRLQRALGALDSYRFDYCNGHAGLLERLAKERPEFVANFCDTGFRNDAGRELHVAAYLDLLDIPYTGSGPVPLGLCFDKSFVNAIAERCGVAVPREVYLRREDDPSSAVDRISYPAFVKPSRADGSLGITQKSIVRDRNDVFEAIRATNAAAPTSDILVQELLDGTEYGVGIVGNPDQGFTVLPILEIDYDALPSELPHLLDYSSKVDPSSPYWNDIRFRRAQLSQLQADTLSGACMTLFERLDLRDYARFDFRTDAAGTPKLLEVNPNPAWCWDGKLTHMIELDGGTHSDLLGMILGTARKRCFG